MVAAARRHPVIAFFVLAYLGSWVLWSPIWLTEAGIGALPVDPPTAVIIIANQLGLFGGPFAAALIVTRIVQGRGGIRALVKRLVQFRFPRWCWAVAIVVVPVVVALGALFGRTLTASVADIVQLAVLALVYLLGGPLQEEIGWRGFALPRLQRRLSPLAAALVLGVLHCFWHTPLFFTRDWDTARGSAAELTAYLAMVVSLSVVLAWLTNAAGGSLVPAVLGHNGVNWALTAVTMLTGSAASNVPAALGLFALAVLAVVITHGRLGVLRTADPRSLPN
jgi:membrane protease YdiL (CAAX protease family)